MLANRLGTNKKPQDQASTKSQGGVGAEDERFLSTPILKDSKSRYENEMEYINRVM